MLEKYVIITAAGAGVRMNLPLPKQFLELHGKPVLMHAIQAFLDFAPDIHIILVLPESQIDFWKTLCAKYHFHSGAIVVAGGPTRFHSVKNGLKQVPNEALVAIHDGVRPLVSKETIRQAFDIAQRFGNAIPVISINESVRLTDMSFSKMIDRNTVKLVQTPQCFQSSCIKDAYNVNFTEHFTDDASVLEHAGERIYLVEGNRENIKITTPQDLAIAQALLGFMKQG